MPGAGLEEVHDRVQVLGRSGPQHELVGFLQMVQPVGRGLFVAVADPKRTIALIREQLPDKAGDLIQVKEAVPAAGLKDLTPAELARIGVTLTDSTDKVLVGSVSDELDKFVESLLEEVDGEQADAA